MITLYYGQLNDFDRGWTIESLWKLHTKNGRFGGWPPALRAKVIIFYVYAYKCGTNRTSECYSIPAFYYTEKISLIKIFQLEMSSCKHSGGHFYPNKYGDPNLAFWDEMFWNQRDFFCIIERRDRVTFTGSIGTIFVGINVKNYDFSLVLSQLQNVVTGYSLSCNWIVTEYPSLISWLWPLNSTIKRSQIFCRFRRKISVFWTNVCHMIITAFTGIFTEGSK